LIFVPTEEEEVGLHPLNRAWRLRSELGAAVHEKKWKRAHNLAKDLVKQIDVCVTHETAHLDGLFAIGTMWYERAPEKAKDMISRFNAKLKSEKEKLPK